jgi:hypothetical protein
VFFGICAGPPCHAAQVQVGALTCSQQQNSCIAYRRKVGPIGSEGLCHTVFNACMKSGVWDGTTIFPYGGERVTGMIRR